MVSIEFTYFFIPVFMGLYAVVSPALRGRLIVATAFLMMIWYSPVGLIPMVVSAFSAYIGARLISRFCSQKAMQRVFLVAVTVINLAAFLMFYHSSYDNIGLFDLIGIKCLYRHTSVIGVTFFSLQAISYCFDVYKGKFKCEKNFLNVAEFVMFFPSFTVGPLLRYEDMRQTMQKPVISVDMGAKGIRLFLTGLAQKLLLSNTMFELWENVSEVNSDTLPAISAWIGIIAFGFSLYFELSAFSNIARGMGALMGFELPQNFDEPFTAYSATDFIKRFNKTLYEWIYEYVYQNLRAITKGKLLGYTMIILSVVIGMLWYGLGARTFIFGFFMAMLLIFERIFSSCLDKIPKLIRRFVLFLLIVTALPILAFNSPTDALSYIASMFGANRIVADSLSEYLIRTYFVFLAACIIIFSGLLTFLKKKINNISEYIMTVIQPVWVIALLVICTSFLISDDSKMLSFLF